MIACLKALWWVKNGKFQEPCYVQHFKGNSHFVQKWHLNLWWISNKTIMDVENITKATT